MISVAYVIGMIVAVLLLAACVLTVRYGLRMRRKDGDWEMAWLPVYGAGFVGVLILVATIGLTWPPFDMEYHRYKPVSGTIDQIQPRMLADGSGGTSQMFAVRFAEDGTTYRCDDSRCSLLYTGDRLWLRCIREWQYAAEHGWKCNYVRSEQAA